MEIAANEEEKKNTDKVGPRILLMILACLYRDAGRGGGGRGGYLSSVWV